ncbi:cobyrinate a,c-diamide synthase [Paludibacterium paludis]|nr:cobyrinate a,c-diamide synthase [Paludibacterium paludis]
MSDDARCRALMIASPASGSGKTTVTAALARLYRQAGRRVKVFKCGADFLDPAWLALASGQPADNLDLWLTGEDYCRHALHRAARDNDVVLVEAAMGLFDGAPSAADLAVRFDLPVALVIDASAMAQTFGALVLGLAAYRPPLRIAGAIANKVAGPGHAAMLRESLDPALPFAAIVRGEGLAERHLGLVEPRRTTGDDARLLAVADALHAQQVGDWAPERRFRPQALPPVPRLLEGRRIAVAMDEAFSFVYPANLACLEALGARIETFSPLAHQPLPEADALWLPGGYPEAHAARLAAHPDMARDLRRGLDAGKPVYAECGGMLALCETLADLEGCRHALWGLFPAHAKMGRTLAAIGPQSVDLGHGPLRCHTFHYSRLTTSLPPFAHATPAGREGTGEAVWRQGGLTASYLHAWFAGNPVATAALFGARP